MSVFITAAEAGNNLQRVSFLPARLHGSDAARITSGAVDSSACSSMKPEFVALEREYHPNDRADGDSATPQEASAAVEDMILYSSQERMLGPNIHPNTVQGDVGGTGFRV